MIVQIHIKNQVFRADLSQPADISIPIQNKKGVTAWHVPHPKIEPVVADNFIGEIAKGASVNFRNILFNPHGNGTHTECAAHITDIDQNVLDFLPKTLFIAELITVKPQPVKNDRVIFPVSKSFNPATEALIVRTLPNTEEKLSKNYSSSNPPYFDVSFIKQINRQGIKHLLTDLPSVDKEKDDGKLICHKEFFEIHQTLLPKKTITELIYVPNHLSDGLYLLDLQVAPFINDAAPARPLIYK
ncbi:MAG: cyclase family protein, partial [Bacteroidetes bacterium]